MGIQFRLKCTNTLDMKRTLLLSFGTLGLLVQSASAQSLFTTTNDFALFSGGSPVLSIDYYSDNSAVNGLGNANAGAAGGIGSLQLTMSGGWGGVSSAPGVAGNQGFLSVFNPGAVAWTSLVAGSGTLSFDVYTANLTDWNQFGVIFNYTGNWNAFFGNATGFTGADGRTWSHVEVPYTINAVNGLGYFGIDLAKNAGGGIVDQVIYVDNFQVTPVPEPSAFALAGIGLAGLLIFRRRSGW